MNTWIMIRETGLAHLNYFLQLGHRKFRTLSLGVNPTQSSCTYFIHFLQSLMSNILSSQHTWQNQPASCNTCWEAELLLASAVSLFLHLFFWIFFTESDIFLRCVSSLDPVLSLVLPWALLGTTSLRRVCVYCLKRNVLLGRLCHYLNTAQFSVHIYIFTSTNASWPKRLH